MVATNLKAETMNLMERRTGMEVEMNSLIDILCRPGGPGLSGNLLDSEGFPRTDIDIPVVRDQRRRLTELKNDHKEITEKIEQNIQLLHSAMLAPKDSSNEGVSASQNASTDNNAPASSHAGRDSPSSLDVDMIASIPFAVIDGIVDGSPTAEDGLQLGDQVVKFGNVVYEAGENLLQKLAVEAQSNADHATPVVVMRHGAPFSITVTPRQWQGRGLLGCSFRIL